VWCRWCGSNVVTAHDINITNNGSAPGFSREWVQQFKMTTTNTINTKSEYIGAV